MLASPRRPSSTTRIFSSAEKCRRVARRMSWTIRSAGALTGSGFCLIFAPDGYDDPEILRSRIASICPTGADGGHVESSGLSTIAASSACYAGVGRRGIPAGHVLDTLVLQGEAVGGAGVLQVLLADLVPPRRKPSPASPATCCRTATAPAPCPESAPARSSETVDFRRDSAIAALFSIRSMIAARVGVLIFASIITLLAMATSSTQAGQ